MKFLPLTIVVIIFSLFFVSCKDKKSIETPETRDSSILQFTVLSVLPHNAEAYTQGLVIHNNKVLESTGQHGTSWIAEVNPGSGQHDKKVILDKQYFGEGITVMNNKIYHLTYKTKVGFIFDAKTYKKLKEFSYDPKIKEGWGITHDNINLIVSDGTDKIHFLDTTDFKVIKTISVKDGNKRVKDVNELEYVDGYIFANIYQTNWIIKLDPSSGKVVGKLDLSAIGNEIHSMYPNTDVLNGIAYDKNSKALLITGKLWPKAYLIKIH